MANIPQAVRGLIENYRRFLATSYRFLDDHLREQFERHLEGAEVVVKGPYVTLSADFVPGSRLSELAAQDSVDRDVLRARWAFGDAPLFLHQQRALEIGRAGRSLVVTTGTGSGKTEAFLLPVLDGIVRRKREGARGVQALLLYPMNALANDQFERMRELLRGTGLPVSYGLYTGDSDNTRALLRGEPAEHERASRDAIRTNPPDILLTNYKQLEFLLVRAADRVLFSPSLRYLVLDELHSYTGALATEVACLIRRLKARAGLTPGSLVAIGTSATIGSDDRAPTALAEFSSVLFGETVRAEDIIREVRLRREPATSTWTPAPPALGDDELRGVETPKEGQVVALAERLTRRTCPARGPLASRIASVLENNAVVEGLEEVFSTPRSIDEGVEALRARLPDRAKIDRDAVRREVEAYLLVGSAHDGDAPPRLRPKLHTFFHGVYDVALCLNPECRSLVPQGATECPRCQSAARPAALCRTCGQDFVKVRFEREGDTLPVGTGDFFSNELTRFLTHKFHPFPSDDELEADGDAPPTVAKTRGGAQRVAEDRMDPVGVCAGCGRLLEIGAECPACRRPAIQMLMHAGPFKTCPLCKEFNAHSDVVTPLRTGTASSVSVLATHHLDRLEGDDRRLLVFADNRQDAAHQAGYTADKHRSFALRHFVAAAVRATPDGLHLSELVEKLYDHYREELRIIPRSPASPERKTWRDALEFLIANEFTRYTRQRVSLESQGLVAVEYEYLDRLKEDRGFLAEAARSGLAPDNAMLAARAVLDHMRKRRAVALPSFKQYIDPNKNPFRTWQEEPYEVRLPDRDAAPIAFALGRTDAMRKARGVRLEGFVRESNRGRPPAPHAVIKRLVGDLAVAEAFLRVLVERLLEHDVLARVPDFPLPAAQRVPGVPALQIRPEILRFVAPGVGYRCNTCRTWAAYPLPTCPASKCTGGELVLSPLAEDDYYVRLYTTHKPRRLRIAEHTAQIPPEERAQRETRFKDGLLDALVASPTLELGVDIGGLLTVLLRNAPPNPARYAQRVGRAGRRLGIGFVSTFCHGGAHDRNAFENPSWLVRGQFDPPRLRLDNPKIVRRHVRSHVLENLAAQLPRLMGDLIDDFKHPTRWLPERVAPLFDETGARRGELAASAASLFASDREAGRLEGFGPTECQTLVDAFEGELRAELQAWEERVRQLNTEYELFSTIGSSRHDKRKAAARERAYKEITIDPQQAYVLNYLSTRGLLPSYQFPVDSFSLDPGVDDTPTLYRPSSIALEEFAPGNFVYANGHKLKSIRVLFAGGPGQGTTPPGRTDAETSGRLQSFHFCERCDEVVEAPRNSCQRCGEALREAVDALFVQAFEAEESIRIGSDEESRQRNYHRRRESLILPDGTSCTLYPYELAPLEHSRQAKVLITNWGKPESKTGEGQRFWLCPDCGRHCPSDPHAQAAQPWQQNHARICSGRLERMILAYEFMTDSLTVTLPMRGDTIKHGTAELSPTTVTIAEALLSGAGNILQLEPGEIQAFVRKVSTGSREEQVVLYETVPGGAGYLEEMARRLPEVAQAARRRLYGHQCSKACYLCLKHYGNQRWHHFFDKDRVRDLLWDMAESDPLAPEAQVVGAGIETLRRTLASPDAGQPRYPRGAIEEPLAASLAAQPELPPANREFEYRPDGSVITVPDFAWPDVRLAVYCDSFAFHTDHDALIRDAEKRNRLQRDGWVVLAYWGRTLLRRPGACATEIADVYRQRLAALGPR